MSWQAFSWHEIMGQAKAAPITGRLQPAIDWTGHASVELLQFAGVFMKPLTLTLSVLAIWRLGADLGWTGDFFVGSGIFSHFQVWVALAVMSHLASSSVDRFTTRAKAPGRTAR